MLLAGRMGVTVFQVPRPLAARRAWNYNDLYTQYKT